MTTLKPQPLARQLAVRTHYLRSTNVEHHGAEIVGTYIPTDRGMAVLRRIARAMREPVARAWSITGPYGAGKSSFALFLHSVLGPPGATRDAAADLLRRADPDLGDLVDQGLGHLGAHNGFIRAVTTAQREPVSHTVLRALEAGAREFWPRRLPPSVAQTLRQAADDPTPRAVTDVAAALAAFAPVLLLVDEFGKNLEQLAADTASTDVFLLQALAERSSGPQGLPLFVVTLQHLAFDEYLRGIETVQRREWGKVQGRFEDVPFLESPDQTVRLVAGVTDATKAGKPFLRRRREWAERAAGVLGDLGLATVIPGGAGTLEACYPLHPVALAALPELCARYGQHGRTLFSFLASREPHSFASFLEEAVVDPDLPLPTVDLARVYDYFVEAVGSSIGGASSGTRWLEIETRIRETPGLSPHELRCLKAVGLLNLLSQGGVFRASASTIAYALGPADTAPADAAAAPIKALAAAGLLTYRSFADEFRLWQGSDVDVSAEITAARDRLRAVPVATLLSSLHPLSPVVAARHSQRVGMLRFFLATFIDDTVTAIDPPDVNDAADGLIVFHVGQSPDSVAVPVAPSAKPVVVAVPGATIGIREAALELAAAREVLTCDLVRDDHVARREVQERIGEAQRRLHRAVSMTFHRGKDIQWSLAPAMTPLDGSRGVSRLVSDVCDQTYRHSPIIRNEMLGRRELTSQAAKARRELLTAMVKSPDRETLGIVGFGPERAMYEAILKHTGVHREAEGAWGFGPPRDRDLAYSWGAVTQLVDAASTERVSVADIYERLMSPPYGLKDGPIPVLLTALLLHRQDDIAVYQDGTFQPVLTAELLERLVKTPDRFAVKTFRISVSRLKVLAALRDVVEPVAVARTRRNATVLSFAAPLLAAARALPEYTRHTRHLSERALAVRSALFDAREPDELLFVTLPRAVGLGPWPGRGGRSDDAGVYAERLGRALRELSEAFPRLLSDCAASVAARLSCPAPVAATRQALQERARPLEGKVLEPKLRAFLLTAIDTSPDDEQWTEAIALTVANQPAVSWRDEDRSRFDANLAALAESFTRLQALHFSALADGKHAFEARRVTVTAPDGHEVTSVVWADDVAESKLAEVSAAALESARRILGPRGPAALLAVLAETVLPQEDDQQKRGAADSADPGVRPTRELTSG
ncbi:MAG TPA: hypothetical protein VNA20_00080 [Frankiaceae bacterium]|nr:hypothetical protein [Frankiaceae bacterium]